MSGNASFTTENGAQFFVGNDGAGTVGVLNMSRRYDHLQQLDCDRP
jgi:hypothetical protein